MIQVAAQFYTLREYCQDKKGFINACKRVKKMGYEGVQLSGVKAPMTPKEMRKVMDGEGLVPVVTHESLKDMLENLPTLIKKHHELGIRYMAVGGYAPSWMNEKWGLKGWSNFIKRFNGVAAQLEGTGIQLGYHNHSHEFAKVTETKRAYDMLMDQLDPRIWFEIDTYWVAHAGANPSEWIRKVAGRIPVIHFKDMKITPERVQQITEIGNGNLNWFDILDACNYSRVQWIAVERDDGDVEAFESLRRSREYIKNTLNL